MCSHYDALQLELFVEVFNAKPPPPWGNGKLDMWPRYNGAFIRRPPLTDPHDEAVPSLESQVGRWALVPAQMPLERKNEQMKLSTFNARDDRVAKSYTFGGAWRRGQHCIVPIAAFYEPDWRSGKAIPTRFTRADDKPMGIAGLWDVWVDPINGERLTSFTLITINAANHELLRDYHKPGDEKRMIVVLPEHQYDAWLDAPADKSMAFLQQYPADLLVATPPLGL